MGRRRAPQGGAQGREGGRSPSAVRSQSLQLFREVQADANLGEAPIWIADHQEPLSVGGNIVARVTGGVGLVGSVKQELRSSRSKGGADLDRHPPARGV